MIENAEETVIKSIIENVIETATEVIPYGHELIAKLVTSWLVTPIVLLFSYKVLHPSTYLVLHPSNTP